MKRVLASMLVLAPALALGAEAVPQEWAYPAMPPGYQVPPGGTEPMIALAAFMASRAP